ncbi:MAG: DUF3426 domain-containing protein [Ectothiorhodospiraceae bacterium]|nr:DUF3426 domain-containing protein [Ectothiorhodospiraceae bacterium]
MYTQCPACAALYRVTEERITAADRRVRCAMCLVVFDAGRRWTDVLPPDVQVLVDRHAGHTAMPPPSPVSSGSEPVPTHEAGRPAGAEDPAEPAVHPGEADSVNDLGGADWQLASGLELEARTAPQRRTATGAAVWAWVAGILLLNLLLVLQVVYTQREELARYAQLRPWLEPLCRVAGCELPLQRDPERLRMLRSQVTDHPSRSGALVATAVIINQAPFRQPYPLLRLTLLDQNQRVAGERWFHPADYLHDPGLRERWDAGMPVEHPVAVRLELLDPGSGSAQYIFEMR